MPSPRRIVCLSAEAADWLWRIGAWDLVVGTTVFFDPPQEVEPKPKVGGFSTIRFEEILALNPDLVIGFSDIQSTVLMELMRRGVNVLGTNQRTLAEITDTLSLLGRIVGLEAEADRCLGELRQRLAPVKEMKSRPRVYFEEWNEPLVSGIAWVSELVERAGGHDIFSELARNHAAKDRAVDVNDVIERNPEIIFASWCGRPVRTAEIESRPGWNQIAAVKLKQIYEIPSDDILQPGFRLVNGYEHIKQIIRLRI